jgi:tetratricopeptide (TPR) repeat protein
VSPPETLNAPYRQPNANKDTVIRATAFSPEAFSARPLFAGAQSPELTAEITKTRRQNEASRREFSENHAVYKTQIRDYTTLAFSMKRAGNTEAEAAAYFCVGVTYDNMGKYEDAVKGYSKFLKLSKEIDDKVGECLAYNCMGMCKMNSATPPNESTPYESGVELTEEQVNFINSAVKYHQMHLESSDDGGRFVANSNLGLCAGLLEDFATAAKYHQDALRIAIRMQSFAGQSVAVGNLGTLSVKQGDYTTAKACIQQHLQLTQSVRDIDGECNALILLGAVASATSDFDDALNSLSQARNVAEANNMLGMLKRISCAIGMAEATSKMDAHFGEIADRSHN